MSTLPISLANRTAYILTGPTSGIGHATALELAKYGTLILVGRNQTKLSAVEAELRARGHNALSIVCDLKDLTSVRNAAKQIVALNLPIGGLLNNAGVMEMRPTKNALGWDTTFATDHVGPFALTEALAPHLPDGANVVFVVSAVEDPERKPAKVMGMRGGRYLSAAASARGEWKPGGSRVPGSDAYATAKQCLLAATLAFARETPRLHFNAVEPGINPGTGLSGMTNPILHFVFGQLMMSLPPFRQYRSTPEHAAQVITRIVADRSGASGVYYDEKGHPMFGSAQAHDPRFQDRVVAETRVLIASVSA